MSPDRERLTSVAAGEARSMHAGGDRLDPILCRAADDRHKDATDTRTTGLTRESAYRLTERIRLLASSLAEQVDKIIGLIDEARAGQADVALGYESWTAYVEREFADALPRLDRSQRQDVVQRLSAKGMSTRAIAPVLGVSPRQVARDVAGVPDGTPADVVDAELVEDEPGPTPIIGRDGKTYPRPAAPPPPVSRKARRNPLPDQYRNRATDLLKSVQALARLHLDDRFPTNRAAVRDRNASELTHAANELLDLLDDLKVDRSTETAASS